MFHDPVYKQQVFASSDAIVDKAAQADVCIECNKTVQAKFDLPRADRSKTA